MKQFDSITCKKTALKSYAAHINSSLALSELN